MPRKERKYAAERKTDRVTFLASITLKIFKTLQLFAFVAFFAQQPSVIAAAAQQSAASSAAQCPTTSSTPAASRFLSQTAASRFLSQTAASFGLSYAASVPSAALRRIRRTAPAPSAAESVIGRMHFAHCICSADYIYIRSS